MCQLLLLPAARRAAMAEGETINSLQNIKKLEYLLNDKKIVQGIKKPYLVGGLIILLVFLSVGGYLTFKKAIPGNIDYVIPNVPYIGLYNHVGKNGLLYQTAAPAVAMALEYWSPGKNNFSEIDRELYSNTDHERGGLLTMERTASIINQLGDYNVRSEHLEIGDLKKYINSEARTPLLLFLPISGAVTHDDPYSPLTLLIGIKENEKKLVFHDYWLGNNYEITYEEFNSRIGRKNPSQRNEYLVVQPADFKSAMTAIRNRSVTPYPGRTQVMGQNSSMMENYLRGYEALMAKNFQGALGYYSKVEGDQKFGEFLPPYLKVLLYTQSSEAFLNNNDIDKAISYEKKAEGLNHDLDKPFLDWPGYELAHNGINKYGIDREPYRVLGDIYFQQEKFTESKDSYMKAMEIDPKSAIIKEKIQLVKSKLPNG